jgi:hypothetical protein
MKLVGGRLGMEKLFELGNSDPRFPGKRDIAFETAVARC